VYLVVYFSSHYEGRAEPGFVFNPRLSMLGAVKMADDRGMLQYVQLPENKTERKRNCMVESLERSLRKFFQFYYISVRCSFARGFQLAMSNVERLWDAISFKSGMSSRWVIEEMIAVVETVDW